MAVELTMTFLVDWVYAVYSSLTLKYSNVSGCTASTSAYVSWAIEDRYLTYIQMPPCQVVKPLAELALELSDLTNLTGRKEPTVIT